MIPLPQQFYLFESQIIIYISIEMYLILSDKKRTVTTGLWMLYVSNRF